MSKISDFNEYAIIMLGSAAAAKTIGIMEENAGMLKGRYSDRYLSEARQRLIEILDKSERAAADYRAEAVICRQFVPCGKDGVFGALWILGDSLGTGLKVNLSDIPIDAAAIELCDYMDINPYEADSTGAYLLAAENAGRIIDECKRKGACARLVGYTISENARVVIGSTERYLTKQS